MSNAARALSAALTVSALAAAACAAQPPAVVAGDAPTRAWYPFAPTYAPGPSVIGMEEWADKPAGGKGRIVRQNDRLVYGGKPVKLWGLNLCYGHCAPDKATADRRAAFYAKHGINAVRLHKFADGTGWAGIQSKNSAVVLDPAKLDLMDYQVAQFKKAGIFVLLSAHFGTLKLGPADKAFVPFLEEFGSFDGGKERVETPHSAIPHSRALQDVQIQQIVALLSHRNPYTGLTYAEDPAVAFVEAANEQSTLFFTAMNPLKKSATLRREAGERFSDWLRAKYGSDEKLRAAWGEAAFDSFEGEGFPKTGESLAKRNILPIGNPWFWDPDQIHGSQKFRARRLLDTMRYLYEIQADFYERYAAEIKKAGYAGEVIGSNWQAGRAYSHFANLHSDWRVGTIDRHNYFGGGSDKPDKPFEAGSMLSVAGSGMLTSGLQQAADRPFMLSEWIHVFPNEWGAEGPALIGAYGMGLQGWDVSFLFQNGDDGRFSDRIGRDQWDATAPQILGLFPAVARQVRRGDVGESPLRAPLNVHVPSLWEGKLSFGDATKQGYDDKAFSTDKVPSRALGAARAAVRFTEKAEETPTFDLSRHADAADGALVADGGQLRWYEAKPDAKAPGGYVTVDTAGTKAVVGFAAGATRRLGGATGITITPRSPFAAVYVTAREPGADIEKSASLVVVAISRARNAGMTFSSEGDRLLSRGEKGPVLLEPVRADIALGEALARRAVAVHVLDHDGRRTGRTLPLTGGAFALDGATDRTPYYEIELRK